MRAEADDLAFRVAVAPHRLAGATGVPTGVSAAVGGTPTLWATPRTGERASGSPLLGVALEQPDGLKKVEPPRLGEEPVDYRRNFFRPRWEAIA